MANHILDYFAETHSSYIHARGKLATNAIIHLLDCKANENILEIGCGTGATLVEMASKYEQSNFFGLESSKIMFNVASKRLRFCRLSKKIGLKYIETLNLPFNKNTFDKIYMESVLAIQEGNDLKKLFLEFRRVLKPNGILLFNETIWLDSTDRSIIEKINNSCKMSFGIIQSSSEYPYLKDWNKLICEIGFMPQSIMPVSEIQENGDHKTYSYHILLSQIYSLKGYVKSKLKVGLRRQWKHHQQEMKNIISVNTPLMEGVIIKAYNKK